VWGKKLLEKNEVGLHRRLKGKWGTGGYDDRDSRQDRGFGGGGGRGSYLMVLERFSGFVWGGSFDI